LGCNENIQGINFSDTRCDDSSPRFRYKGALTSELHHLLTLLTVNHVTLVEHLSMEFAPGMTAITGETGAGKSLVLDALGMALGDRGDTERIRTGASKADITAVFAIHNNTLAQQWLSENALEDNDGECIIRRTLSQEGRSRGFINGQPVTMQQLQQLGELMIDIHSQHEHQSLLKRDTHRRLLDDFAQCNDLVSEVSEHFKAWQALDEQVQTLESNAEAHEARRTLLEFQVTELNELALAEGEVSALEKEQQLLANAEHILRDSHAALMLCRDNEEGNILSLLNRVLALLQTMPEKSASLEEAENLLDSATIQTEEAAREIQHHIDSFDLNPERLQEVEDRLSAIYQLARKHRVQPDQLPERHQQLSVELESLSGGAGGLAGLRQQRDKAEQTLSAAESKLSAARKKASTAFADAVNRQLSALAMASANLQVELTPKKQHSPQGLETVEFLICTNPGQPHKPLNKVASGGELSRVSLAIQVVAAQHTSIPTLVFDEVDVGVGGAVAEVVGKLLRQLGDKGQVICVTHLPQVASFAHQHLIASKSSDGKTTESQLTRLKKEDRVLEIARMLGGAKLTDQTRAHAREMLEMAET
jgi:DNA repair protein RecN (Recombination protein N)